MFGSAVSLPHHPDNGAKGDDKGEGKVNNNGPGNVKVSYYVLTICVNTYY